MVDAQCNLACPQPIYPRHALTRPTPPRTPGSSAPSSTLRVESLSSSVLLRKAGEEEPSDWLRHQQRNGRWVRVALGAVGFIILLSVLIGLALWVGNEFLLPKQTYSTKYSQHPKQSSRATKSVAASASATPSWL